MGYSTTAAAITALRTLLNDGATDKICWRKKVLGGQDGTNKVFKTFEPRRLSLFTGTPAAPLGVYVNGTLVTATADDLESGEFTLTSAPATTDDVRATYYFQFYDDPELDTFLQNSSNMLGLGSTYISVPDALNNALLHYAAQECFKKLSVRMAIRASSTFNLEDAPKKEALETAKTYADMSKFFGDEADKLRKLYYSRQDQNEQPAWSMSTVGIAPVGPMR